MSIFTSIFNKLNTQVILRLVAGFFFLPHVLSKIIGFEGTTKFFASVGFPFADKIVIFTAICEFLVAICLLSGKFVKEAAFFGMGILFVAALSLLKLMGPIYYWNMGGPEYLFFWIIILLIVLIQEWQKNPGIFGGLFK